MLRIRSIFEIQFWDIQTKVKGWQLIKNGSHSNFVIEISVWWKFTQYICQILNINGALLELYPWLEYNEFELCISKIVLSTQWVLDFSLFLHQDLKKEKKIHDFKLLQLDDELRGPRFEI